MKKWLAASVVTLALPVAALPVVAASTAAGASPVRASAACTAGAACTRGAWQVMPFSGQVRANRAVLLYNGKVLLVAGSGNDISEFNAGTFKSAVYNPANGTITQVSTPADLNRAGAVQLPDGKVLVLGGNKAYPTALTGSRG